MKQPAISKPGAASAPSHWMPVILFFLAYVAARLFLRMDGLSTAARVTLALLPLPAYLYFFWSFLRIIRRLDELERRIQLEAMALAFPMATVALMVLGLLEIAVHLPPEDLSYRHVWALMPMMYFLGLGIARRRYQ